MESDEEFNKIITDIQSSHGFNIRDRRYMLKTYRSCFIGFEAVDWLITNVNGIASRDEAVAIGQRLIDMGVIFNVRNQNNNNNNTNSNNNNNNTSNIGSSSNSSGNTTDPTTSSTMDDNNIFKDDYIFYSFVNGKNSNSKRNNIFNLNSNSTGSNHEESNNNIQNPLIFINHPKQRDFSLLKDELFQLGLDLMHSQRGIKLQKKKKTFLGPPINCFTGTQLIEWLMKQLDTSRKESIDIATRLMSLNIFYEIGMGQNNNNNNNNNNSNNNNNVNDIMNVILPTSTSSTQLSNIANTSPKMGLSGSGSSSPLSLSSPSAFTNPNYSTGISNQYKPFEDNSEVYYEFLAKPEAIINHVAIKKLPELHLAHKSLTAVPITIINTLNCLSILDLSYNNISDSISLESVSTLSNIESLNISHNSLSNLPSSLSRLVKLTKLNLGNNSFVNIPTCIFQLNSLEKLNLSCNSITVIPEQIKALASTLVNLDLRNNKLVKLPKELGLLSALATLDVSGYNKIQELPPFLAGMPCLRELDFPESVKNPPKSVTSKGFTHIIGHLKDMIDGTTQLQYLKLIVLGNEKSGRTSLVRSLTKSSTKTMKPSSTLSKRHSGSIIGGGNSSNTLQQFNPNIDQTVFRQSESVDVTDWKLDLPNITNTPTNGGDQQGIPPLSNGGKSSKSSKRPIKLVVMDFKFQSRDSYYNTHSFFLSERAFYLVTYDITKDLFTSQIDFWINSIKAKAPLAPIYVVATHIDNYQGDYIKVLHQIESFLNERCLEVTGVVGVSSNNTQRNMDLLKQEIITTLTYQSHWFNEQIPLVYAQLEFALLEESLKRPVPIIAWEEYQNIAKLSNITTHEKLVRATNTLHRWGSILWFDQEKYNLKSIVIISPQWLSDCFSALLASKGTCVKFDSIICLSNLKNIWRSSVPEKYYVKLIKIFEHRFRVLYTLKNETWTNSLFNEPASPLVESGRTVSAPLPTMGSNEFSAPPSLASTSSPSTSYLSATQSPLRGSTRHGRQANLLLNTSSSLIGDNISQFVHSNKIIIPCLLPFDKPSHLPSLWDTWGGEEQHQLGKFFRFTNVNKSFFDRLMVRFLCTMEPSVCWSTGILFRKSFNSKDSYRGNVFSCGTLVEFNTRAQQLQMLVRGHDFDACAKLYQLVLENVDTLTKDLNIKPVKILAPCSCSLECRRNPPLFPIDMVESAFNKGESHLRCPHTCKLISIQRLAPDITLTSLPSAFKILPEELSVQEQIGTGATAKVFKGVLRNNTLVAVKQLDFEGMELGFEPLSLGSDNSGGGGTTSPNNGTLIGSSSTPSLTPNSSGHHFTRQLSCSSLSSNNSGFDQPSSTSSSVPLVDSANLNHAHKQLAINEFRREVWLMSDLTHHNIVQMKGFSLDPYSIVLEYMDMGSLSGFLAKKREMNEKLSWPTILKIAKDIASGMLFLHNISPPLVHRDLKSPNILLTSIPTEPYVMAKVSDFGLSRAVVQSFVTKAVDNPRWLAPEILKDMEYNEKGDIYSFGIILWELYHLELPFENIAFMSQLEDCIKSGQRPTISPQCNPIYAELITKCWHDDQHQRPPFQAILKTLEEINVNINKSRASTRC